MQEYPVFSREELRNKSSPHTPKISSSPPMASFHRRGGKSEIPAGFSGVQKVNSLDASSNQQVVPVSGLVSTNSKLPLTQVGNVALSKGMYLALMKRREQIAFSHLNSSSTPRPRVCPSNNTVVKQSQQQYQTCVLGETQNHQNRGKEDWPASSLRQRNEEKEFKEIAKTKKIKKDSENSRASDNFRHLRRSIKKNPACLADITKNCLNNSQNIAKNPNNSNTVLTRRAKQLQETQEGAQKPPLSGQFRHSKEQERSKSVNEKITKQNGQSVTAAVPTMKERQKMIEKLAKEKGKLPIRHRKTASSIGSSDKENNVQGKHLPPSNFKEENLSKKQGISRISENTNKTLNIASTNSSKPSNPQGQQDMKFSHIWHEEAQDMMTERAMFIQRIRYDKKKKYSQSPKRCVPGFKVKFQTSKSRIFAFNCFRDKDLTIEKKYRPTIDVQEDNDYDTDSEQLKESVYNVFQSLCVAVCEEKISQQIINQQNQQSYC